MGYILRYRFEKRTVWVKNGCKKDGFSVHEITISLVKMEWQNKHKDKTISIIIVMIIFTDGCDQNFEFTDDKLTTVFFPNIFN